MKNLKRYLFCIVILLAIKHVTGQETYIKTDSTTSFGIKVVDGGELLNSKCCQVQQGQEIITYTPDQIIEYKTKDGVIYVSKEIEIFGTKMKVFLERIVAGEINLYYFHGEIDLYNTDEKIIRTYYIEKDSSVMVELKKNDDNDYKSVLNEYTQSIDVHKFVSYNRYSLSKFVKYYNKGKTEEFPFKKFGIIAGYEFENLVYSSNSGPGYLGEYDYPYKGSFNIGAFFELPIVSRNFALHTDIIYSYRKFTYNFTEDISETDIYLSSSAIDIPFHFKYTFYKYQDVYPFIFVGGLYNYSFNKKEGIYQSEALVNIVNINQINYEPVISDHQIGYSIGTGLQIKLNHRKSLFFELRYNRLFSVNTALYSNGSFRLLTSVNL